MATFILSVILALAAVAWAIWTPIISVATKRPIRWPSAVSGTAAAVLFALSCLVVVPPGHVGVVVLFGSVNQHVLLPGIGLINPMASVYHITTKTEAITYSAKGAKDDPKLAGRIETISKDGLQLSLEVTIQYHANGADAAWLFESFAGGADADEAILIPVSRSAVREVVSRYTGQEAYGDKREELPEAIRKEMEGKLTSLMAQRAGTGPKRLGIVIDGIEVRDVALPPKMKEAIEDKLAEQQTAQRMEFTLQRERLEAERKVVEARGIADFQKIVVEGIDERLLRWKGIDATLKLAQSTNTKVIVIGSRDGLPLIMNVEQK